MSAVLIENGQYIGDGGALIVAGSIYIGRQGTNPLIPANRKDIFSDRGLLTPLPQPQDTGLDGRAVNKIWTDGAHSIQVYDANGVLVYQDLDSGGSSGVGAQKLENINGTDVITATGNPTVTALTDGELYVFTAAGDNTGVPATIQIDALSPVPIKSKNGGDLPESALIGGTLVYLGYNATSGEMELISGADTAVAAAQAELSTVSLQIANLEDTGAVPNDDLLAVSWAGLGKFFAVGKYYAPGLNSEFFISTDGGQTFTVMNSGNPNKVGDLLYIAGMGNRLTVGGQSDGTDAKLLWCNDPVGPWSEVANPANFALNAGSNGYDTLNPTQVRGVAVGDPTGVTNGSYIVWSDDPAVGVTQAVAPKNLALKHCIFTGYTSSTGKFFAGGDWDTDDPYLISSPDGVTWTEVDLTAFNFVTGTNITSMWRFANYSLITLGGGGTAYMLQSFDEGATWIDISSKIPGVAPESIEFLLEHSGENALLFRILDSGDNEPWVTKDLVTWREIEDGNALNNVLAWTYGEGRIVAVDAASLIRRSTLYL